MDNVQMFFALRHDAVVRRHREEHEIDAMGAGEHVFDEPLVTGNIDNPRGCSVGKVEVRKTEIDGDAALFFFLEAVGVLAGQRFDQAGLAVVYMSGCPDNVRHGSILDLRFLILDYETQDLLCSSRLPSVKFGMRSLGSKIVLRSRRKRSSRMRPMIGGRAARNRCAMALAPRVWCSTVITTVLNSSVGNAPLPICAVESSKPRRNPLPRTA